MRRVLLAVLLALGLVTPAAAKPDPAPFLPKDPYAGYTRVAYARTYGGGYVLRSMPLFDVVPIGGVQSGGGGVGLGGTNVWTGSNTFTDSLFFLVDDGDPTKKVQFQASTVATGTTRTFTLPNVNDTVAVVGTNNNFSVQQNFTAGLLVSGGQSILLGNSSIGAVQGNTTQTPDIPLLLTGTLSNSFVVMETADAATDQQNGACGSATCANPSTTWMAAAAVSPQTQYNTQSFFGNAAEALKTLTESAATSLVRINVAASAGTGGILDYGIFAADATDQQLRQSSLRYSVTNKAGTETCTITTMAGAVVTNETNDGNSASISAGTLTYGITCDTTPANAVDIQFNAVSSLTQTTLQARYQVRQVGPGQAIPQ